MNQLKQLFEDLKEINKNIVTNCGSDDTNTLKTKHERLSIRFQDLENRYLIEFPGV